MLLEQETRFRWYGDSEPGRRKQCYCLDSFPREQQSGIQDGSFLEKDLGSNFEGREGPRGVGMSKKHQNWKFHDAPKKSGYTSPGNPKTPWVGSHTSKMTPKHCIWIFPPFNTVKMAKDSPKKQKSRNRPKFHWMMQNAQFKSQFQHFWGILGV